MAKQVDVLDPLKIREFLKAGEPGNLSDGAGLTLTLSSTGVAAWVLRFRHGGKQKELTLGRFPDLTLANARKLASAQRSLVQQGTDVAAQKQRQKIEATQARSVRHLVDDYVSKVMPSLRENTTKGQMAYLNRDVLPRFGAMAVKDVDFTAAHHWLTGIAQKRTYRAAANARKVAVSVFEHAVRLRLSDVNPFQQVNMRTVAPKPQTKRRTVLTDAELGYYLLGLDAMSEVDAFAIRLQMLTGCRVREVLGARWSEVDFAACVWRIPKARCKNGEHMKRDTHDIRLPRQAMQWLRQARNEAGDSDMVFPPLAQRNGSSMTTPAYQARLDRYVSRLNAKFAGEVPEGVCRRITTHDFRAIARTNLSRLGASDVVAKRALNQKLDTLDEIYSDNYFEDERAVLLCKWADKMDALAGERGGVVIPFQSRGAL